MESFKDDDPETNGDEISWRTLDSLPPEIILHVFSYLPAKFVINVLSKVCKLFEDIIENDTTWKMRIFERWPKIYPIVPSVLPDMDWKFACIEREEQYRLWSDFEENMKKFHLYDAHFGCVNVVQLIENGTLCVSGGRDGRLKLWSIERIIDSPEEIAIYSPELFVVGSSHHSNAWLWDVAFDESLKHVYSSGFDCNIKSWDLQDPFTLLETYSLSSPILCLAHHGNLLASGSFGRNVNIFDQRIPGSAPILSHNQHKKSVLCVAIDDKYVISGGEDRSAIIYDLTASKVIKKLEFEYFPLSMSYGEGQLFFGDVNNSVHVIDPAHGEFNLVHTIASGHSKKVTGVQHSFGSIITCSTDKTIRILEPNLNPAPIAVLASTNEVAGISCYKNILA